MKIILFLRTYRTSSWVLPLTVLGCMAVDPRPTSSPGIEDVERSAGASSATNFPPPHAGTDFHIKWEKGSELNLFFRQNGWSAKVTGNLTFYQFGGIPALTRPNSWKLEIRDTDTLRIDSSVINHLGDKRDTVGFNILVEVEGYQAYLLGFAYLRRERNFTGNAYYENLEDFPLDTLTYYRASIGNAASLPPPPGNGESQLSFYIPGTPAFWKVDAEVVMNLGPLPRGNYPLRLMRITVLEKGKPECEVEIFKVTLPINTSQFEFGDRVLSQRFDRTLKMLPPPNSD